MNYLSSSLNDKKNIFLKKKINFNQNLKTININFVNLIKKNNDLLKLKKKFEYLFNLKNLKTKINSNKIDFLKLFLTKQGKIVSNTESLIPIKLHRLVSKFIRRARIDKLIPFQIINEI